MLRPSYPIETERMLLRPYVREDVAHVLDLFGREDVARYVPFGPLDADGARDLVERRIRQGSIEAEGQGLVLAAELRDAPGAAPVAEFMLRLISEESRQGEVGWVVHPDHQGRGLATEGAARMLRIGFEDLGLHRIAAECDPRNPASVRVMEHLGMRREAHLVENEYLKGEWIGTLIYAILDREWAATTA